MAQQKTFLDLMEVVKRSPENPDLAPQLEKVEKKEVKLFSETEALETGAVLTATIEQGHGNATPNEGDLVFIHMAISDGKDGPEMFNTCVEGKQSAFGFLLEKSPRMPRGLEIAVKDMRKGERRGLRVRPEFFFQHPECEFHLPDKFKECEGRDLTVDLRLVSWHPAGDDVYNVGSGDHLYLLKTVLKEGQGWENPRPPYEVRACLTARAPSSDGIQCSGEPFFKCDEANPLEIAMGSNQIPEGVEGALTSMVKQERSVFVIPVDSFVGPSGRFPSAPESLHQIEIEIDLKHVAQVRDMYGDGKVIKRRLVEGVGEFPMDCPMEDCAVRVHYKARPLSKESENQPETWVFDSAESSGDPLDIEIGCGELPNGVEGCVRLMLPGEISNLRCAAEMAYTEESVEPPPGIDRNLDVEFEISLISFDKDSKWAGAKAAEVIKLGESTKELANRLFKDGKYKLAVMKYQKLIRNLTAFRDFDTEEEIEKVDGIKLACLGNLASCCIQENDYAQAVEWCNKALRMDEENAKIIFRRGRALSLKGDHESAMEDFDKALELDPGMKTDIDAAIVKNKQRQKAAIDKQRGEFKNFFAR
ncbi:hypothetical protein BSKO_03697 [Bryopsis sp. KO-2023]|nr:hypothetical protein BSKO_03697 [Bryopsis sp. KO-2023]